ncbi:molybdate transport repressor ModE-like protein [Anaerosolibacter carboniphilus]|uniref:Molybdate transport repressor ModE-like protein n=1 Tax=Anaerosolibacter carboniphilus TaxID=1417629 RepID=A0A841L3I9_9FIRM|nr:LysR family transcriptional regulator [Anaerosolibacter carboniphilus]MBB6216905.1 molybdate transport repressor ModE-like protein [Anaerosolibacter carboniphilus]
MDIRWRIWIENNQQKIFGKGPRDLLLKVDELGSLRQAALALGMSYSKAWNLVSSLEKSLEIPILEKRIGGVDGGSSVLTKEARTLLAKYEILEHEVEKAIIKIYKGIF